MLDWYTGLLTFSQAFAVWLVSIIFFTVLLWIEFSRDAPGDRGNFPVALVASLIIYPALYWATWVLVAFLDLIGWLWTH